jgi:hypothetical protein
LWYYYLPTEEQKRKMNVGKEKKEKLVVASWVHFPRLSTPALL